MEKLQIPREDLTKLVKKVKKIASEAKLPFLCHREDYGKKETFGTKKAVPRHYLIGRPRPTAGQGCLSPAIQLDIIKSIQGEGDTSYFEDDDSRERRKNGWKP